MRQRDYALQCCIVRRRRWQKAATLAMNLELSAELVLRAIANAKREHENVTLLVRRRRHVRASSFNLNSYSESQMLMDFRFKVPEVKKITDALGWSGTSTRRGYVCDPILACCILLFRLATTQRWCDMEVKFGMFACQLSEVFWEMVQALVDKLGWKLDLDGAQLRLRADMYADSIRSAGAPLHDCVGFIDCTKIRMQRPGGTGANQRACYSGHKRVHCLIYQTLSTPDGLVFALHGPVEGRRHDLTLFRSSGWNTVLEESLSTPTRQFYIYGDQAYILRPWVMKPFGGNVTVEQAAFNAQMSSLRVSVEHTYKDLKQMWTSQDFSRKLKVREAPIGTMYKAAALLWNMRTCAYRSGQTIATFRVDPPTLEDYLA